MLKIIEALAVTEKVLNAREKFFVEAVLEWGRNHLRRYPWRSERDPWKVLIAEIMLQRTTPGHVLKVYDVFLRRYPNPKSLTESPREEVEEILRPLGMVKRVRKILETAREICRRHGGRVPLDPEELMKLPGVGRYTAHAVLSLSAGKPYPLIDRNSARVLRRFFALPSERRPRDDEELWRLASRLIPPDQPALFNLSLLDIGSIICRPKKPRCDICPLSQRCSSSGAQA